MRVAWRQFSAWLLVAAPLVAAPPIATSSARFVLGEVIVQFASGSEGHRIVMQAGKQATPDLTDLAPVVGLLETMTSIPLTAKQLLSGQRLLLGIDTNRVLYEAAGRLRRKPGVRAAGFDETAPEPSRSSSGEALIRVEFTQDSSLNRLLAEVTDNPDSPVGQELLADLQADLAIPLAIRTAHRDSLLLNVDLPALTHLTVQRLSTVSEIREAQLNYLLSIRRPERLEP